MDKTLEFAKRWGVSIFSGILGGLIGPFDYGLKALIVFIVIDVITGTLASFVEKELDSEVSFRGALKKFGILAIFILANILQRLVADVVPIRDLTLWFFIGNEGLSILENTAKLGVPYPQKLKDALMQLKNKNEVKPKKDETKEDETKEEE